jgi:sirohydrochlorin ferrochelatase
MDTHVVLVGHGSRSAEANASLVTLAHAMALDLEMPVHPAYLEMAEPSIPATMRAAVAAGARHIVTVPYFLTPGMHVRRDIVEIVDAARAELHVTIDLSDFLGNHPELPRLLTDVARAALPARRAKS